MERKSGMPLKKHETNIKSTRGTPQQSGRLEIIVQHSFIDLLVIKQRGRIINQMMRPRLPL